MILTGQGPSEALIERADYVSELKKSSIRLTRVLRQEMESSGNAEKQEKDTVCGEDDSMQNSIFFLILRAMNQNL